MTPDRLRECLTLIGWSGQALARRISMDERTVRRWASGSYDIPVPVATWLERLAAFHEAHRAP